MQRFHPVSFAAAMLAALVLPPTAEAEEAKSLIRPGQRVLFMGDSITHAGHYVAMLDYALRRAGTEPAVELINLGLPSETCSGLSEPDHPFPRPNAHERLQRALERVKPDVVVACYGMNDGVYYPFSEKRFAAYRAGVDKLIKAVDASGARLCLMTPPAFDPLPLKKKGKLRPAGAEKYAWFAIYEGYDDVLKRYSKWIMQQEKRVNLVVDLHTPVNDYLAKRRKDNPDFVLSGDGVHVNVEGHRILAAAIWKAWGNSSELPPLDDTYNLIERRQQVLHDSWLSHVGHKRPGVKAGPPLKVAVAQAAGLDKMIRAAIRSRKK